MKSRWPAIVLVVLQVFQALTLLPWLTVAGLSIMAFDAPDSASKWQPWAFVLFIWSYPLWILGGIALSWILYSKQKKAASLVVAVLLTLPAPLLLLVLMLS